MWLYWRALVAVCVGCPKECEWAAVHANAANGPVYLVVHVTPMPGLMLMLLLAGVPVLAMLVVFCESGC